MARERLGFIGLGVMGGPMSTNLVRKSGLPVTVFDLVEDRVAAVVAAGAEAAASVGDVAERADVVFLSLLAAGAVEAVVLGPGGLAEHARAGQVVVDMSTSPVALAQRLDRELQARGVVFLDAPVSRTRQAAIDGTLAVTVGARDRADLEAVLPWIECMAAEVTYCGGTGAGALMKLLNNLVVFETVVALSEAVTVARKSGLVSDELLFEVLGKGSANSFALANHGVKALLPDLHPLEAFSTLYMLKDITYNLDYAAGLGLELPAASLAQSLLQRTAELGYADEYHTSVVKTISGAGPRDNQGVL